jgi:hypothetical protein
MIDEDDIRFGIIRLQRASIILVLTVLCFGLGRVNQNTVIQIDL